MHPHKDKLEYQADGIRDRSRGNKNEQHIQASMQEETAKALYEVAEEIALLREAIEEQNSCTCACGGEDE